MAKSETITYKRLTSLLAAKRDQQNTTIMAWLCIHLSLSLLKSTIACLRGARSLSSNAACVSESPVDLAMSEGRLPLTH